MNASVIDTSVWVSFFRGSDEAALEQSLRLGCAWLTPIVYAELLSAPLSKKQSRELEQVLNDLPLTSADRKHWRNVGFLRRQLLKKGVRISLPDAHIAQAALELDALLLTHDKIFSFVSTHTKLRLA